MTANVLKSLFLAAVYWSALAQFAAADGGDSRGNGDWFVKPLPILKFQFPESSGYIEGVQYTRMDLPRCSDIQFHVTDSENEPVDYFPGKDFVAIKVQTSFNNIVCSYGVIEKDPDKALQILVNNPQINTPNEFGGVTIYSKSYGGPAVVGNFLVAAVAENKLVLFGNGRLNNSGKLYSWYGPLYPFDHDKADAIYLPTAIKPSARVYFGNCDRSSGLWTLMLPIAYRPNVIPLQKLSKELSNAEASKDKNLKDLLNIIEMPAGFPGGYQAPWETIAQIWTTLERTSKNSALRDAVYNTYQIPFRGNEAHSYSELQILSDTFQFKFLPTIDISEINRASYHRSGRRTQIELPLMNPTWRVVADMIHEMTHAVQNPNPSALDDLTFKNEMEAHLNERAYLEGLSEKFPVLKTLISTYNSIAAAGVAKVDFVLSDQSVETASLCSEVVRAYRLDPAKISASSFNRFNCTEFQ